MYEAARQKVCELIGTYGSSLPLDRQRCESLLRDVCANYKQEVFALTNALREGVVTELLSSSEGVPKAMLVTRLAKRLEDNLGMREDISLWAVETWAIALGKVSQAELSIFWQRLKQQASVQTTLNSDGTTTQTTFTKEEVEAVVRSAMNAQLVTQPIPQPLSVTPAPHGLKKINVFLLTIFVGITVGIYSAVWFMKGRASLNALRSVKKIRGLPVLTIIALLLFFLFFSLFIVAMNNGENAVAEEFARIWPFALMTAVLTHTILSFRVRRILEEHFNIYLGKGIIFSKFATLFFSILYLQYKINRLPK